MAKKAKSCYRLIIAGLLVSFHLTGQVKKSNLYTSVKLVDSYKRPVKCLVYKWTEKGRIPFGETEGGQVDIDKECYVGEFYEFVPTNPNYNAIKRRCYLREPDLRILTKKEMQNLTHNATLYLSDSSEKKSIAISALSQLELAGVYQEWKPYISDSLSKQVYFLTAKWLNTKEPALLYFDKSYNISSDLILKLNNYQGSKGIRANYIESSTLSKMATVEPWDVYNKKFTVKSIEEF